jgi:hypothetical protein
MMAELLSDAIAAFTSNGVPVAHVRFHDAIEPPYAEVYLNETRNFGSYNRTHKALASYDIVLHAVDRDLALEGRIEDALDAAYVGWDKKGGYRGDADLVTTTYMIEVYER